MMIDDDFDDNYVGLNSGRDEERERETGAGRE